MKKCIILLISIGLIVTSTWAQEEKYNIQIEVEGLSDSTVYMAYYYGKGQFYRDTSKLDKKGKVVFSDNKDTLAHGMYSLLTSNNKLFDFIVDEQEFSLSTNSANYVKNMKVKGSPENKIFFDYLRFLNNRQKQAQSLSEQKKNLTSEKQKESIQMQIESLDKSVKEYLKNFHKEHAGTLPSNFIKALDYPEVPEAPKNEDGSIDSTFRYKYFKEHFFDNFDFSDGRLVRTATYHDKITYYLDKLTPQDPDSIIASADVILGKAQQSPELFKYALNYMTSHYERSEQMGMDAVFVHLGKNYFMKGKADEWFTKKQKEKLSERVNALEPLLLGKKAPNIVVKDTAMKEFIQLNDIDAKFTVVYIWSPECGHCKKATPKLKKVYNKYRDQGLEVFAVGNEFENEEWKNYIKKHKLDWINGSDGGDFTSNFRTLYDVYSTPQTYLLDENKKILAKKINIESLDKIIEYYMSKEEKKAVDDQK